MVWGDIQKAGKTFVQNFRESKFHQGMIFLFGLLFIVAWIGPESIAIVENEATYDISDETILCSESEGLIFQNLKCETEDFDEEMSIISPKYEVEANPPSDSSPDASLSITNLRNDDSITNSNVNVGSTIELDGLRLNIVNVGTDTVEVELMTIHEPKLEIPLLIAIFLFGIVLSFILATYSESLKSNEEDN